MSRIEAKKIVKRYAEILRENNYPFSAIYLFGSCAREKAHKWSDIDVAIVSDKLKKDYDKNRFKLWYLRRKVDTRIEPHPFTVKDFNVVNSPLVEEIKKTGIRIA